MIFNSFLRNKGSVLILLCATFLFSACGSSALSDPLTRDYKTYTGEFKSLGGIEVQDLITHLFETEDGDVLYAYSDRYDLDSKEYAGVNVEAYGVVTTYSNLDKALFEVKRISEAPVKDETVTEVTNLSYQNPDLGFSMNYPSNWTLSSTSSSVTLAAPIVEEKVNQDTILIAQTDATLTKTSEDPQEDRATEVRSYVSTNYADLAGVNSELSYAGTDRLLSVRYKTTDGDVFYFIPRAEKLYELSYNHEEESDADRLTNSNIFSTLVSGFRFTSYGEVSTSTEPTEDTKTPVVQDATTSTNKDQVSFATYHELESKPYEFKMTYPGPWYYAGSSTGYTFSDTSTDNEDSKAILSLSFNSGQAVGVSRNGETVSVTVEIAGRSYTLSGPSEYENVMQIMATSITSTKE